MYHPCLAFHSLLGPVYNPLVYFDIEADHIPLGRIIMKLRHEVAPATAENFRALCTHERGFGYRLSTFHHIIPGFVCQGGHITSHNGTGGRSIYGATFGDENFELRHAGLGTLSMANCGPNSNACQFLITMTEAAWLDGKHVVFGQVVDGLEVVKIMESLGSPSGAMLMTVVIKDCGQLC